MSERKVTGYDNWGYPRYTEDDSPKRHTEKRKAEPATLDITVEERRKHDKDKLLVLKGINEEIADAILNYYATYDEFKKAIVYDQGRERFLKIPGINKTRADSIMKQLKSGGGE